MTVAIQKRTGVFPTCSGLLQPPELASSSPHRYTAWPPLVHPHSAPSPTQVPRMLPPWARPAAAISLEWQCWHVTGFRAPIAFFFCPTFYLKISNSSFFGGRGSIVQGTVYTLPGRMRVPGGALCPILPESGRPLFPGTWPRTAVHPWTMLWSDVYSYSVARPHSYVLGDCFDAGPDVCVWPSPSLLSFRLDCPSLCLS